MALIKCPECGKEISDKAEACPNCGCPITKINSVRELPDEEKPELFECVECGRPLPIGIEKCIYCNHIYTENYWKKIKEESETGVWGTSKVICPICQSRNMKIEGDIPIFLKIFELWGAGAVLPQTKIKYRDKMIYNCQVCGTVWNEKGIIKKGEFQKGEKHVAIPVSCGCVGLLFGISMLIGAAADVSYYNLLFSVCLGITGALVLASSICLLCSISSYAVAKASRILFQIAGIVAIVCNLFGIYNFLAFFIILILFIFATLHEKHVS